MSPLWKDSTINQTKIIQNRPSPKSNNHILSLAQSLISVSDKNFPCIFKIPHSIKGISVFASKGRRVKASMTVEAAIVLPLFLFFFLNLCSAIEMLRLHGNLQLALWGIGNRMSIYGAVLSDLESLDAATTNIERSGTEDASDSWWKELAGVVWSYTYVKAQIEEYLGEDYLETSPLTHGTNGLQFLESNVFESKDCFEVVVTYSVSPFSNISAFIPFRMSNRYYGHLWNGYEIPKATELVYVTETGEVYHTNAECTHLKLSIQQVGWWEMWQRKNMYGDQYSACEKCCNQPQTDCVYITEQGNCYHYVNNCPGLKRTIVCMTISEVGQMRLCQRCAELSG